MTSDLLEARAHELIAEGHALLAKARRVRAETPAASGAADEYLDQTTSPLGHRRHLRLARAGAFPSRKVGKRVLVKRSDMEAYLATYRPADPENIFASLGGR